MELTKEYFEEYLEARLSQLPTRDEFKALQSTVDNIKQTVDRIDKRDVEDSDAHAKNFVNHERRITRIEKQLKLKPAA
jgi:predicted secreted Zn-dependent protease